MAALSDDLEVDGPDEAQAGRLRRRGKRVERAGRCGPPYLFPPIPVPARRPRLQEASLCRVPGGLSHRPRCPPCLAPDPQSCGGRSHSLAVQGSKCHLIN